MENNIHTSNLGPELGPISESEIALRALVDELFERSDKESFRIFHLIADFVKIECEDIDKIDSRQA